LVCPVFTLAPHSCSALLSWAPSALLARSLARLFVGITAQHKCNVSLSHYSLVHPLCHCLVVQPAVARATPTPAVQSTSSGWIAPETDAPRRAAGAGAGRDAGVGGGTPGGIYRDLGGAPLPTSGSSRSVDSGGAGAAVATAPPDLSMIGSTLLGGANCDLSPGERQTYIDGVSVRARVRRLASCVHGAGALILHGCPVFVLLPLAWCRLDLRSLPPSSAPHKPAHHTRTRTRTSHRVVCWIDPGARAKRSFHGIECNHSDQGTIQERP